MRLAVWTAIGPSMRLFPELLPSPLPKATTHTVLAQDFSLVRLLLRCRPCAQAQSLKLWKTLVCLRSTLISSPHTSFLRQSRLRPLFIKRLRSNARHIQISIPFSGLADDRTYGCLWRGTR
uniref:Uncharacterized protein n=1 Tax=Pseudomonas fluorescens (strain SBW25) TaxID=216595 RepID=A4V7U2_PSEFS|nr:hypothetical protein pQBR0423 [Pseudomonas fluorescens SBW25]